MNFVFCCRTKPLGRAWGLLMGPVDKDAKEKLKVMEDNGSENASKKRDEDGNSADGASVASPEDSHNENNDENAEQISKNMCTFQIGKVSNLPLPHSSSPSEKRINERLTKSNGKISHASTPITSTGARKACVLRTKLTKLAKKSSIAHVAGRLVKKVKWLREQDNRMIKSTEPVCVITASFFPLEPCKMDI